jgi:tetratricopeptide (TPR) repeat protein
MLPQQELDYPGKTLLEAGKYEAAAAEIEQAITYEPRSLVLWRAKAYALLGAGQSDAALTCFDQMLGIAPSDAEVHSEHGDFLAANGLNSQALEAYESALQLQPARPAQVLRQKAAVYRKLSRTQDALDCYNKALEYEHDATTLVAKGDILLGEGSYAQALLCYDEAQLVGTATMGAQAWTSRGDTVCRAGFAQDALVFYDRALLADNRHSWAWRGKALAYRRIPDSAATALECIVNALNLDPENALFCIDKGNILYDLGRYSEAEPCYRRASELDPGSYYAFFNRSIAMEKLGNYGDALDSLEKALAINSADPEAWVEKGVCLGWLRRVNDAIECYDRALSLKPDSFWALNNKGWALTEVGRNEEAIPLFDHALALDVTEPLPWTNKSKALRQLRRYDEALQILQDALKQVSDRSSVLDNLGLIYSEYLYDDASAFRYFVERRALSPDDPDTRANVAECLTKLKRYDESRREALEVVNMAAGAITKCAMHIIVMASYALQGQSTACLEHFGAFLQHLTEVNADDRNESAWTFTGLQRQVQEGVTSPETRFLVLAAMDLLLGRPGTNALSYFSPARETAASAA